MKTVGFDKMPAELDDMERLIEAGLYEGLIDGAEVYEQGMKDTRAYVGMSEATRTSTVAYVVGPNRDNLSKVETAHQAAASLLSGFTGHKGQPFLEEKPGPGDDALMVVGTVPTDYQISLETQNAGEKAFVGPELDRTSGQIFEAANNGVRRRLKR